MLAMVSTPSTSPPAGRAAAPTADELLDQAKELARKPMRGAPLAQRAIKECMYKALYEPDGLETYNTLVEAALAETEDHAEGSRAYAEKREPAWTGR